MARVLPGLSRQRREMAAFRLQIDEKMIDEFREVIYN
jgi:hypothetical protein